MFESPLPGPSILPETETPGISGAGLGWLRARGARRSGRHAVLVHYEEQTEVEVVAEDKAALDDPTQTITDATDSLPRPAGSRP